MKKTSLTLTFCTLGLALTVTSCQKAKEWTCVCEISGDRYSLPIPDQKKSDAKNACNALETGGASCSLD